MDEEKSKYVEFLRVRILKSYITTGLGCLVAAMSAVGQKLEGIPEYHGYGTLLTGFSSFLGALTLLLVNEHKKQ